MRCALYLTSPFWLALVAAPAQTVNPVNRDIQQSEIPSGEMGPPHTHYTRNPATFSGTLVDASCTDRSGENLAQAPEAPELAPGQARNVDAAKGIQVAPKIIRGERADAMEHHVPDMRARMSDATCGITGNTRAFAILLDNGHLLNLDQGGNTLALQAVQSSSAGRAMLNGAGPALKPRVSVEAFPAGDRLLVKRVSI